MRTPEERQRDTERAKARYRDDPEKHRRLGREFYWRHKDRLLAERREKAKKESLEDKERRLAKRRITDKERYPRRGEKQKVALRQRYASDEAYRLRRIESNFVKKYGLKFGDWKKMYDAQEGKCLGCTSLLATSGRKTQIDHCHISNRVRGLLCSKCNRILGCAGDRVSVLERLAAFLRQCPNLGGIEHTHEDQRE